MRRRLLAILGVCAVMGARANAHAQAPLDSAALRHSIEQLRSAVGRWDVVTEFLGDDGAVARRARGTYAFEWVIPDRVVRGRSEIPELQQVSAILFYVSEARRVIEMASVGVDGTLWVMTGPLGGEMRSTAPSKTPTGGSVSLRFTRFNVSADQFESRMEYTVDDGKSWNPGNHQVFRRVGSGPG